MTPNTNFILGNSQPMMLQEMKDDHIIPTFKSNERLISQPEFIELTGEIISNRYNTVSLPDIRVSHSIHGRIPEAKDKEKHEVLPHEKTLYYERTIFLHVIDDVKRIVMDQELSLIIGGVKSYKNDPLHRNSLGDQHFTIFCGFIVPTCSNLAIWNFEGSNLNIKVRDLNALHAQTTEMLNEYQPELILDELESLQNYSLTDQQFAQMIGRSRMYHHLPMKDKKDITPLEMTDTQMNHIAKSYYHDKDFAKTNGDINLWNVYNLFTGANKSSYIDDFIPRGVNASSVVMDIKNHLDGKSESYFLN